MTYLEAQLPSRRVSAQPGAFTNHRIQAQIDQWRHGRIIPPKICYQASNRTVFFFTPQNGHNCFSCCCVLSCSVLFRFGFVLFYVFSVFFSLWRGLLLPSTLAICGIMGPSQPAPRKAAHQHITLVNSCANGTILGVFGL